MRQRPSKLLKNEGEKQNKMNKSKNIGIDVKVPEEICTNDKNCPFHGTRVVRGRSFIGKIVSVKMKRNAIMEIERRVPLLKYERYEKRRTRIMVHNPECIGAKETDTVRVMETRKISKMKSFVIVEKQ